MARKLTAPQLNKYNQEISYSWIHTFLSGNMLLLAILKRYEH